ncbi:hypothetical protein PGB90_003608 [Kerria lacca]
MQLMAKKKNRILDTKLAIRKIEKRQKEESAEEGKYVEDDTMLEETGEEAMEDEDETMAENVESPDEPPEGSMKKHIHPCVCDLSQRQLDKINKHLFQRGELRRKFAIRVKEIEQELAAIEEERLEKEREMQEQRELFGDEYEMVGKKKKRKKRSARRASMVSLGVKQVINWRKPPKIEVKNNKTSLLRKRYTSYCGKKEYPASPIKEIDFGKEPNILVRTTTASDLRSKFNLEKKENLIKNEDKRPLFRTSCYV